LKEPGPKGRVLSIGTGSGAEIREEERSDDGSRRPLHKEGPGSGRGLPC
jgi:hypothetical protein